MVSMEHNPAWMFISFIHARHFFSLVNRKIIENYKLNGFDTSLDPFEIKLWFGNNLQVKMKDIDMYYSYCSAANLNGYRFFCPTTVACSVVMMVSQYFVDVFEDEDHLYQFLMTLYIAHYIFFARIKVIPEGDQKDQFHWFIDCLMSLFTYVSKQTKKALTPTQQEGYKTQILQQWDVLLSLFYHFGHINTLHDSHFLEEKDYYTWLFYDELNKKEYKKIFEDFFDHHETYLSQPTFSATEKALFDLVLPADLLIRYLFDIDDLKSVIYHLIWSLYDRQQCDTHIQSLSDDKETWHDFLLHITDYRLFKSTFLPSAQSYIRHVIRNHEDYDYETEEEINDFMSAVGSWDISSLQEAHIPAKLQQEGATMEKMINFYITFLGGFWTARGDSGYIRRCKPDLLKEIVGAHNLIGSKKESLYYYGWLLYSYSKNIFYYKYTYENIRAGKENFHIPYKADLREVYNNMYIVKMFNESFVSVLLQDMAPEDIKIYVKDSTVLDSFKELVGDHISDLTKMNDTTLLIDVYQDLLTVLETPYRSDLLQQHSTKNDIHVLKEHMYSLDFWIAQETYHYLSSHDLSLREHYDESSVMGMLATLRDTLLGYLLYKTYLQTHIHDDKKDLIALLERLYIVDVINVREDFCDLFYGLFAHLQEHFTPLLQSRGDIHDNQSFFMIWLNNWLSFCKGKSHDDISQAVVGEDIIWLRGYLKHIAYYNRRYLIPQEWF